MKGKIEIADLTINQYLTLTDVFKVKLKEYFEEQKQYGVDYKQYESVLIGKMAIELLKYLKSLQNNFNCLEELEGNMCDCYRCDYEGWFSLMYKRVFESMEFDKDFLDGFNYEGECGPYEAFYYEGDRAVLYDFEQYVIHLYKVYQSSYISYALAKVLNVKAVMSEVL